MQGETLFISAPLLKKCTPPGALIRNNTVHVIQIKERTQKTRTVTEKWLMPPKESFDVKLDNIDYNINYVIKPEPDHKENQKDVVIFEIFTYQNKIDCLGGITLL